MRREILLPGGAWPALRAHLLGQGEREQLAFLLAAVAKGRGWLRLLVRHVLPVAPDDLARQSSTCLEVRPEFSQALLRRCYETGLSLIEVHSHPFARRHAAFSAIDLANEADKARYIAQKIPHIRHAAMVVGHQSLDAHLWEDQEAVPIDLVRPLDPPVTNLIPTSALDTAKRESMPAPWLDRQVRAFGQEGQARLQAVRVGVVGCGGTGSAVVQMLAHLGVRRLVLVDPDIVEVTNLNRLVGARPRDAHDGRPKVKVARRLARQINPGLKVQVLALPAGDPRAVAVLKGTDLILGCVDNHACRLILNQLAIQYLVPYLDLGAGLEAAPEGGLSAAGGQVRLVCPGRACLACTDGIDRTEAAQEMLSPLARQRQAARGYIHGIDIPTPAVLFLNNAIASLAVAEFVNMWTGYRTAGEHLYFDLLRPQLTSARADRWPSCIACGTEGTLALGDQVPLPGVGVERLPDHVPVLNHRDEV